MHRYWREVHEPVRDAPKGTRAVRAGKVTESGGESGPPGVRGGYSVSESVKKRGVTADGIENSELGAGPSANGGDRVPGSYRFHLSPDPMHIESQLYRIWALVAGKSGC